MPLLVRPFADDREHQLASVGKSDINPIVEFQLVKFEEHGGAHVVVNVAQDDRRALLTW
jgi:hypothetical protein